MVRFCAKIGIKPEAPSGISQKNRRSGALKAGFLKLLSLV
jgi:hypothetical protein